MSSHSIRPPYLPGTSLTNPWYRYLFSPHFKLYTESSNSRGRERFPPIDRPHPASTTSARALPSLLRQLPLERRILRMCREKPYKKTQGLLYFYPQSQGASSTLEGQILLFQGAQVLFEHPYRHHPSILNLPYEQMINYPQRVTICQLITDRSD